MSLNRVKKIKIVRNKLILNAGVFKHYAFALQIFTDSLKKKSFKRKKRKEYQHCHNIIRFRCFLILIVCIKCGQSNTNVYYVAPLATTSVNVSRIVVS